MAPLPNALLMLQEQILGQARDQAEERVQQISGIDWNEIIAWETLIVAGVRSLAILLFAVLAYRLLKVLTGRLGGRQVQDEDPIVKRLREQRAQTIAGLLNNVGLVAIMVIAGLMVLGVFIDDIGPLVAAVGILGLAVSFGAQSLVKDVITGAFILLEGQYGIGDVIRIKETAGLVEKITLRTTVLRDIHGVVHVIPNGEILMVSNLTKNWSRAVLEIGVAYKEDVDHVMQVLREIGAELRQDSDWGVLLLDDIEIPGVESFADSAVVIRLMAKTLPLKQWDVARELRRRIKKRFDAEGIEIPFPHTTFYWGERQLPPALAAAGSEANSQLRLGGAGRDAARQ
ncbi:MAG: mechanosensitive ion channel family protein [Longimicrobiales bacterium]